VWEYEDQGWTIRFSPILRGAEVRGKPGQTLILMGSSGVIVMPEELLYSRIKKKATPYGNLAKPYIVAVNTMDDFAGKEDVIDALFGKTVYRVDRNAHKMCAMRSSKYGAAFLNPHGEPTNTRVSAVLVAYVVTISKLAVSETPTLWHNPWAQKSLDPELWQGPQISIDPDTYEIKELSGFDYHDHLRMRLDYHAW
jgi:hypothetical protein